jgi:hypothetical protein
MLPETVFTCVPVNEVVFTEALPSKWSYSVTMCYIVSVSLHIPLRIIHKKLSKHFSCLSASSYVA